MAAGTALPDLATPVLAALRRHPGIAVGNILGSNVFSILDIGLALAAALSFRVLAALPAWGGRIAGGGYLVSHSGHVL